MSSDPRAIIMTVGLPSEQGGDVLNALLIDYETFKPDYLILICSRQSLANARRMIERTGLPPGKWEVVELEGAHDLDEVFRQTNDLIGRLVRMGFSTDRIAINYTAGTKVMSSGAVLSAVFNRIMELRYVTGLGVHHEDRDHVQHRILSTKPGAVFAYQNLLSGFHMMRDLRFRSAFMILETIEEDLLGEAERQVRDDLCLLARAYGEWDSFHPEEFLRLYRQVRFQEDWLKALRLDEKQLHCVEALAAECAEGRIGPMIITDLYNNALRRQIHGRTDDALARLYRALELLAQWVLLRDFEIDTNDVETRRIPPRDRVAFEALRSLDDGKVRIGLRKAFELLFILEARIGLKMNEDAVLRRYLEWRSESILAHGLHPADPAESIQLLKHALGLFDIEIDDFQTGLSDLQFPWLPGLDALDSEGDAWRTPVISQGD